MFDFLAFAAAGTNVNNNLVEVCLN